MNFSTFLQEAKLNMDKMEALVKVLEDGGFSASIDKLPNKSRIFIYDNRNKEIAQISDYEKITVNDKENKRLLRDLKDLLIDYKMKTMSGD